MKKKTFEPVKPRVGTSIKENPEYKELRNDYVRLQLQARLLARLAKIYVPDSKPTFMSKTRWEQLTYLRRIADQVLELGSDKIEYEIKKDDGN